MTNNQATLQKLDQMRLHGMARALRTSLDTHRASGPPTSCWPTWWMPSGTTAMRGV